MPLRISCPICKTTFNIGDELLGKRIRCRHCQQTIQVAGPPKPAQEQIVKITAAPPPAPAPAAQTGRQPPPGAVSASRTPKTAAMRPPTKVDKMPPIRNKTPDPARKSSLPLMLIIGGSAALALLLLGCVGVSGYFYLRPPRPARPVTIEQALATAPPAATQPAEVKKPENTPPEPALPAAPSGTGGTAIPPQVLQQIKEATVFVKVQAGRDSGSGSGFVMHTQGETAYIVTNHHVVTSEEELIRPGRVRPVRVVVPVQIDLVFNSGTPREHINRAEIVATDSERDLAVLKVTGVKDMPKAIDIGFKPQYAELMPVLIFGFPFGELLSAGKGNPAITIHHGSVSSIQLNDKGDMAVVQIEGAINPGNSGGPVVDTQGHLVGVAVKAIHGANIGRAIPPDELTKMLYGRVAAITLGWPKEASDKADMTAEIRLIDPLNQVKEVGLLYLPAASTPADFRRDKDLGWPALPGGTKVDLKIDGQKATGGFTLPVKVPDGPVITFQAMYVNGQGKTIYTQPGCRRAPRPADVASKPPDPAPPVPGVPPPPTANGASPPNGWKDVGGGFKKEAYFVWLPTDGKIDDNESSMVSKYGQIRVFRTVCQRRDGSLFAAGQIILPPQLTQEPPKVRQDFFRDMFLDEVNGKLIAPEKSIRMELMAGKEYLAETPTGIARYRVIGTGVLVYRVLFVGTKKQMESKDIDAFFDSFRRKPPTPDAAQPNPNPAVPTPPAVPAQPGVLPPPPKVSTSNDSVKGDAKDVMGAVTTPVKIRANILDCMFWADNAGTALWAIDGGGTIFRISFPDLKVTQKIELGRKCCWLAPSAEGLIVSVEETEELWVLDPATFAVKKAIKVPKIKRASSAANLSLAFAHDGRGVLQVDLKTGALSTVSGHAWNPTVSPDGKYLFTQAGGENMARYVIRDGKAIHEQTGPRISGSGSGPFVSPDSKFVCLTAYNGNAPSGGGIYVYPVENIEARR